MSDDKQANELHLGEPGVPADQGLSSLGLLMQLAGSVFAAYAALMLAMLIVAMQGFGRGGGEAGWLFLILAASVGRSLAHRAAGASLLYGAPSLVGPPRPLAGVNRYIVIALAHTALVTLILVGGFHMPARLALGAGAGFAAWPLALAALLRLPRFRRFEAELPVGEDKGFEAAAILMTVLGACGLLGTGAVLLVMLEAGGQMLQGAGVLLVVTTAMLVIRSGLHVQAGLAGLRETSVDRSVELANRYANFGMISSFCAAGALLLTSMTIGLNVIMLAIVAGVCWMLMAWPAIVRRFFGDRQFADLLAGDAAAVHRRAPDAGLTGLGWLLFGHAALGATVLLPQLLVSTELLDRRLMDTMSFMAPSLARSPWWGVGQILLQGWAGYELIRMGRRHKVIASVYAIIAAGLAIYVTWPVLEALEHLGTRDVRAVMMFVPIALQLVLPVATLILVHRSIAPTATARFRPRAPEPSPRG